MAKLLKKILIVVLVVALAAWICFDLYRPHKVDIREFDADEVARLDTAMWRSYYARQRFQLFREAGELLDTEFHFPFWRRQLVAYYAAKAAFDFKDGRYRLEYERAMPDLRNFYGEIHDVSTTDFDVENAARLELEWWIVHRERQQHPPGDLARALARRAAAIYGVPSADLRAAPLPA